MSWEYAVRPRKMPLKGDPAAVSKAIQAMRQADRFDLRAARLLGAFDHFFAVLAAEQDPKQIELTVCEALAWLEAITALHREDGQGLTLKVGS